MRLPLSEVLWSIIIRSTARVRLLFDRRQGATDTRANEIGKNASAHYVS